MQKYAQSSQMYYVLKEQKLRGMLHVGEVKFTRGWDFFEIHVPFTSGWKLKISTPGVKWTFWPFCMIFQMFSFYKNTDILLSYN